LWDIDHIRVSPIKCGIKHWRRYGPNNRMFFSLDFVERIEHPPVVQVDIGEVGEYL
jgi:hypothetical protein